MTAYIKAVIEAAKEIRKIACKSPEHGNAIMDLLGDDNYDRMLSISMIDIDNPDANEKHSGRFPWGKEQ